MSIMVKVTFLRFLDVYTKVHVLPKDTMCFRGSMRQVTSHLVILTRIVSTED